MEYIARYVTLPIPPCVLPPSMPFQNLKSKLTKSLEPFLTSHLSLNELQAAEQTIPPQQQPTAGSGRITEQEVYRYRKQRGVNLGACVFLLARR